MRYSELPDNKSRVMQKLFLPFGEMRRAIDWANGKARSKFGPVVALQSLSLPSGPSSSSKWIRDKARAADG